MTRLSSPLKKELGDRTAQALDKTHGVTTVGELIHVFPRRYYRRGELTTLSALVEGKTRRWSPRWSAPAPARCGSAAG